MMSSDAGYADNVGYQLDALAKVSAPTTGEYDRVGWVNVETVHPPRGQRQCQQQGDCTHQTWRRQSQHFEADSNCFLLWFEHLKYGRTSLLVQDQK